MIVETKEQISAILQNHGLLEFRVQKIETVRDTFRQRVLDLNLNYRNPT